MKLALDPSLFAQIISAEINGILPTTLIQQVVYDTRRIPQREGLVFFAFQGKFRDGQDFISDAIAQGVSFFVVNESFLVPENSTLCFFKVKNPLIALQQLAQNHREKFSIPVIGITGSIGKTTIKEWLAHILADRFRVVRTPKSYNSQLGVALSILEMNASHELAIFEAGISQRNEMDKLAKMIQPTLGILSNVASAHRENFEKTDELIHEKVRLFDTCHTVWRASTMEDSPAFSNFESVDLSDVLLSYSPFQEKSSLQNLALTLKVARAFIQDEAYLMEKVKTIPRLALRMESFDGIQNNFVINDTYNLDLDALNQSLEYQMQLSDGRKRVLILGLTDVSETKKKEVMLVLSRYQLDEIHIFENDNHLDIRQISNAVVLIKGSRNSEMERIATLFQLKKHKTRVEIDFKAIRTNLHFYKSCIPEQSKLLVMVKASSYGSGADKMAVFLENTGISYLGVAYADEGVELRKLGVKIPILVMNAEEDGFQDILDYELLPAIYSFRMLDEFIKLLIRNRVHSFPVHLKLDTGMRRLGFQPNEVDRLIAVLLAQPEVKVAGLYSHMAETDNYESRSFSENQIALFREMSSKIEQELDLTCLKHLLNSEGIPRFPEAHFDLVRLGIGLYGYSSNPDVQPSLEPAIAWKTVVSQVKTIAAGESVGYGRQFIAKTATKVATVPVGYADGFRRSLSKGKGGMYISGQFCRVLGNVCMDMCMLDVTGIEVQEGDEVEIIGENQSLADFAKLNDTITYEILTSISKRVHRIYIEE